MSRFNISDQIKQMITDSQENLFTSLPARVITYYPEEQCVDVRPILRQRFDEHSGQTQMPIIYKVPVIFPSAGGGILSFPIFAQEDENDNQGDIMMLEFSMRTMEEWLVDSTETDVIPVNNRFHNLTDAVAKPSIYQFGRNLTPHARHVELKFKNTTISIQDDDTDNSNLVITTDGQDGITINVTNGDVKVNVDSGDMIATIGGETTIDCSKTTLTGDLKVNGDIDCDKTVTAITDVIGSGISLKGHKHIISSGSSAGETLPPTP